MRQKLIISLMGALLLSGCEQMKHSLGMSHYQPDEYNVSSNPPLSLPNDYYLRPPAANASSETGGSEQHIQAPQNASTQSQALLKYNSPQQSESLKADQQLRSQLTSHMSPKSNIRHVVDQEAAVENNTSPSLVNHIMGWKKEFQKNVGSYKDPQTQAPSSTGNTEK